MREWEHFLQRMWFSPSADDELKGRRPEADGCEVPKPLTGGLDPATLTRWEPSCDTERDLAFAPIPDDT